MLKLVFGFLLCCSCVLAQAAGPSQPLVYPGQELQSNDHLYAPPSRDVASASTHDVMEESVSPERVYKYGKQEHSIIVTPNGFFPDKIYVRRNVPVHINLVSVDNHKLCFEMKDFSVKLGVESKLRRIEIRPKEVGPFEFHCPINNLRGQLIVRD